MSDEYYLGELGSESKLSSIELDVSESPLEISKKTRLATGKLVKDIIAVKRVFNFSYEWLAGQDSDVVDSGLGRDSIREMYDDDGAFNLRAPLEGGGFDDVTVHFNKYKEKRIRTTPYYLWNLSFSLVEE